MRKFSAFLVLTAAATISAAVLNSFSAGAPAKAADVNANFAALDTAIQNRATKAGLDATDAVLKGVQATMGALQTGKADASAIAQKVDSNWVKGRLVGKADTGSVSKKADASWVSTQLATLAAKSDFDALSGKQKSDVATLAKATLDSAVNIRKAIIPVDVSGIQASVTALQSGKADQIWVRDTLNVKADTNRVVALEKSVAGFNGSYLPKSSVAGTVGAVPKYLTASSLGISTISEATPGSLTFGGVTGWVGGVISTASPDRGAAWTVKNPSQSWSFQIRGDGLNGSAVNSWVIQDESLNMPRVWGNADSTNVMTPLNVEGKATFSHELFLASNSSLKFGANSGAGMALIHAAADVSQGFNDADKGDLAIRANDSKTVRIGSYNGTSGPITTLSVGLNGAALTGDLSVSGKIHLSNGSVLPADYVFEPDYKLASLSEVEAFTKANKHLPEVPSASEMTSNGVDLAAMNMVLLKKVEELTLHAIALQKELDSQKTRFEERLERLEAGGR